MPCLLHKSFFYALCSGLTGNDGKPEEPEQQQPAGGEEAVGGVGRGVAAGGLPGPLLHLLHCDRAQDSGPGTQYSRVERFSTFVPKSLHPTALCFTWPISCIFESAIDARSIHGLSIDIEKNMYNIFFIPFPPTHPQFVTLMYLLVISKRNKYSIKKKKNIFFPAINLSGI